MDRVRIGQLAAFCGVSRDTIRFYERAGLLPKPRRTATRHRIYDQKTAQQIRFIRPAQDFGLTLDDIRQLIELREAGSAQARSRAAEILRSRLTAIEQRLAMLRTHGERLKRVIERADERPDSHVLELNIDGDNSLAEA